MRWIFRLLMIVVLALSPILFPLALLVLWPLDGARHPGGLGEMYRWAWGRLIRGYL